MQCAADDRSRIRTFRRGGAAVVPNVERAVLPRLLVGAGTRHRKAMLPAEPGAARMTRGGVARRVKFVESDESCRCETSELEIARPRYDCIHAYERIYSKAWSPSTCRLPSDGSSIGCWPSPCAFASLRLPPMTSSASASLQNCLARASRTSRATPRLCAKPGSCATGGRVRAPLFASRPRQLATRSWPTLWPAVGGCASATGALPE